MKNQHYILLLLINILCINIFATPQSNDILIYKGDTLNIDAYPLENYFNDKNPKPEFLKRNATSTNWKGYTGIWEIKNDSLFLVKLYGAEVSQIFKNTTNKNAVFVKWFSGSVISPYGKIYRDEEWIGNSVYEFEREFIFTNGILKKRNNYDNSKSKLSKYTHDNFTLFSYIEKNTNHNLLPDSINELKVYIGIESVNEKGKIDSVKVKRGFNVKIDNEAVRVIKSIPNWDVYYKKGKLYNYKWTIPVTFDKTNTNR